jgi:5-methylcytosine-specific restriction enzyme subunit McrC
MSYLYSIEWDKNSGLNRSCEGILLYPMNGKITQLEYTFREHRLRVLTIDLNREWELIRNDLLNIILF